MTDDISKFNPTGRFTGLADAYAKGRPTYPSEAIDFIVEKAGLTDKSILVDVGCGTGISARLFAARGIQVWALDPNQDMLDKAIEQNTIDEYSSLKYVAATAENTGLANGFADAVLAAQAFHWFRPEETLKEFHRILKADGFCFLVWNERADKNEFTKGYSDILYKLPNTFTVEMKRGYSGNALLESAIFKNAAKQTFANEQVMDENGLLERAFSTSYAPREGDLLAWFKQSLLTLFARCQNDGKVVLKYETSIYYAQRK